MPFDVDEYHVKVQWLRARQPKTTIDRECWLCGRNIPVGTKYQYLPLKNDDGAFVVHAHLACYVLMSEWDEEQKRIYNRFEMGDALLAVMLAEARYEVVDPRYVDWEDEFGPTNQLA